jgi:hypothetical protein
MAFGAEFTPLAEVDLVDDEDRARLQEVGIGSIEELADAITSSPESVAHVLHRSGDSMSGLLERVLGLLDEDTREKLAEPRTKYATGALPPHRRSFTEAEETAEEGPIER